MGLYQDIVDSVKELVSAENRDKIQEIFDTQFNILSNHFDDIYKDASKLDIDMMTKSFISIAMDAIIKENKEHEKRSVYEIKIPDSYEMLPLKHNDLRATFTDSVIPGIPLESEEGFVHVK